jgi:hypothetical protein
MALGFRTADVFGLATMLDVLSDLLAAVELCADFSVYKR